mmetsp:Transcript_5979/g.11412  ORF Transcript_5979/g.11412 Transcript_5979/m.11412 type:complete len:268 (-) Transcript_5979:341-1144(-)
MARVGAKTLGQSGGGSCCGGGGGGGDGGGVRSGSGGSSGARAALHREAPPVALRGEPGGGCSGEGEGAPHHPARRAVLGDGDPLLALRKVLGGVRGVPPPAPRRAGRVPQPYGGSGAGSSARDPAGRGRAVQRGHQHVQYAHVRVESLLHGGPSLRGSLGSEGGARGTLPHLHSVLAQLGAPAAGLRPSAHLPAPNDLGRQRQLHPRAHYSGGVPGVGYEDCTCCAQCGGRGELRMLSSGSRWRVGIRHQRGPSTNCDARPLRWRKG